MEGDQGFEWAGEGEASREVWVAYCFGFHVLSLASDFRSTFVWEQIMRRCPSSRPRSLRD